MASARRPRLTPVAAPTDPYVSVPGVQQPKLSNINIGALQQLSGTLAQFGQFRRREEKQLKAEAEDIARQSIGGIAELANRDDEVKRRVSFLNLDSEVTAENLQTLKELGIKDYDNPYLAMSLRSAWARQQVHERGYRDHMTDPEFVGQYTSLRADKQEQQAEQLRQEHMQSWMKENGQDISTSYQQVFAAEMNSVNQSLGEYYNRERIRKFEARQKVTLMNDLSTAAETAVRVANGLGSTEELEFQAQSIRQVITDRIKISGDEVGTKAQLMQSIEAVAERAALEGGQGVDEMMDALEDEFPQDRAGWLKIRRGVAAIQKQLTQDNSANISGAIRELTGRANRERRLAGQSVKEFFDLTTDSPFMQLAQQVSESRGVNLNELISIATDLEASELTSERRSLTNSDPALIEAANNALRTGNKELLDTLMQSEGITEVDKLKLQDEADARDRQGLFGDRANTTRNRSYSNLMSGIGDLVTSDASAQLVANMGREFNQAFEEFLQRPENAGKVDAAAAHAESVVRSGDTWTQLLDQRTRLQPDYWTGERLDKRLADRFRLDQQMAVQRVRDADPDQANTILEAQRAEERAYRNAAEGLIEEIVKTPEFRRLDLAGQQRLINRRLDEAEPQLRKQAMVGRQATDADKQLIGRSRIEALKSVELPRARLGALTGNITQPWISATNFETANLTGRDYLTKVWNGGRPDLRSLQQNLGRFKDLQQNAADYLRGHRSAGIDTPKDRMLAQFQSPQQARQILEGQVYLRGLEPEELLSGQFQGVPLTQILGTDYIERFPLQAIALYPTVDELDEGLKGLEEDGSRLAQVLDLLGVDITDSAQVQEFERVQRNLIRARGGAEKKRQRITGDDPASQAAQAWMDTYATPGSEVLVRLRNR